MYQDKAKKKIINLTEKIFLNMKHTCLTKRKHIYKKIINMDVPSYFIQRNNVKVNL